MLTLVKLFIKCANCYNHLVAIWIEYKPLQEYSVIKHAHIWCDKNRPRKFQMNYFYINLKFDDCIKLSLINFRNNENSSSGLYYVFVPK